MSVTVTTSDHASTRPSPSAFTFVLLSLPVALFVYGAWLRRWTSDDGFINVRVVNQILAGHGPVFNTGERVEAVTSPLWTFCLVVGKVVFFWLPIEWTAVLFGIAMSAAALGLALLAAGRVYGTWRLLPFGVIIYAVIPPARSYATAGLENGLAILWIATWYFALVAVAHAPARRPVLVAAFVIGLGPLVRPDLAVMTIVAGACLLYLARPLTGRRALAVGVVGLGLPVAYQIFRMAYYGALVPNTAFAKTATAPKWASGWAYLMDFVSPYWLWLPALLVTAVDVFVVQRAQRDRTPSATEKDSRHRHLIVFAAPIVAGTVYGAFVVRGGGDFMHGRMLLASTFAVLLPVAAIPRSPVTVAVAVATVLWAAVPLIAAGPGYSNAITAQHFDDEPRFFADAAHRHNPVTLNDYRKSYFYVFGAQAHSALEQHPGTLTLVSLTSPGFRLPLDPNGPDLLRNEVVYAFPAIGIFGVEAGNNVYVADDLSLANPIGARLDNRDRRVGGWAQEGKSVPASWTVAMFADPTVAAPPSVSEVDVAAARRALDCTDLVNLLARARAPLTIGRVITNLTQSLTTFGLTIKAQPAREAAACTQTARGH
jgi:arabinofuranosyltransferase